MWLVNTTTLELENFQKCPQGTFAILSHTWGNDGQELNFDEFRAGQGREKVGFEKIKLCCDQAKSEGLQYAWVDTCCIDKRNSTELSEAINSMFAWYAEAKICYVYLADVGRYSSLAPEDLRNSRWFTRGWTLQELIAPDIVMFYTRTWDLIGDKTELADELKSITGIDKEVLSNSSSFLNYSIAQRMFWASNRETTRLEDSAYCLIGLFSVNIPMLYGEGSKAFLRLQQSIMEQTDDETIFAWTGVPKAGSGLLAPTVRHFAQADGVRRWEVYRERPPYVSTNRGLSIELRLLPCEMSTYVAPLQCARKESDGSIDQIVIFLGRTSNDDQYRRVPFRDESIDSVKKWDLTDSVMAKLFVPDNGVGLDLAPNAGCPSLRFESDLTMWNVPFTNTNLCEFSAASNGRQDDHDVENGEVEDSSAMQQALMSPTSRITAPVLMRKDDLNRGLLIACKSSNRSHPMYINLLQFGFDLEFRPVCKTYSKQCFKLWRIDNKLTSIMRLAWKWRDRSFKPQSCCDESLFPEIKHVQLDGLWYEMRTPKSEKMRTQVVRGSRLKGFKATKLPVRLDSSRCREIWITMRPSTDLKWDIQISERSGHGPTKNPRRFCWRCLSHYLSRSIPFPLLVLLIGACYSLYFICLCWTYINIWEFNWFTAVVFTFSLHYISAFTSDHVLRHRGVTKSKLGMEIVDVR